MPLNEIVNQLLDGFPCEECENVPEFGTLYKTIRMRNGIVGRYIADIVHIDPSTLTRTENNERLPEPKEMELLIDGLRCSIQEKASLVKAYLCTWYCSSNSPYPHFLRD